VMQCVAVWCSVLQCAALRRCDAVCCSVLQRSAHRRRQSLAGCCSVRNVLCLE